MRVNAKMTSILSCVHSHPSNHHRWVTDTKRTKKKILLVFYNLQGTDVQLRSFSSSTFLIGTNVVVEFTFSMFVMSLARFWSKINMNKLHEITDKLIMGVVGKEGDATQLAQFVSKNLQLYKMKNKYILDAAAAVHFTRNNLAKNPCMINMLVAGYDDKNGGQLYSLDILASCVKVPFAVHGFGGYLSLGILDRYYKYALSEAEAYEVMKLCVGEIQRRLFISLPNFQVKVVSSRGIKELPTINAATFLTAK